MVTVATNRTLTHTNKTNKIILANADMAKVMNEISAKLTLITMMILQNGDNNTKVENDADDMSKDNTANQSGTKFGNRGRKK